MPTMILFIGSTKIWLIILIFSPYIWVSKWKFNSDGKLIYKPLLDNHVVSLLLKFHHDNCNTFWDLGPILLGSHWKMCYREKQSFVTGWQKCSYCHTIRQLWYVPFNYTFFTPFQHTENIFLSNTRWGNMYTFKML